MCWNFTHNPGNIFLRGLEPLYLDQSSFLMIVLRSESALIRLPKKASIQENFNKHSLPDIVCPWGCWKFVERCQFSSFQHVLALIDPQFQKWNLSNFPPRFLSIEIQHKTSSQDKGKKLSVMMTCSRHSAENLQHVHPPMNPSLFNISPNKSESLAVAQQQLHIVKKPKFNSHSSHLIEERGSFGGVNSSTLQFPTFLK